MPRKWQERYNYTLVKNFHADNTGCDYCRQETSTNLYVSTEGKYCQEMLLTEKSVRETKARERIQAERDRAMLFVG